MTERSKAFLRDWMLPMAMVFGASAYLLYHYIPQLRPLGPIFSDAVNEGQRLVIGLLLFFQFIKTPPGALKLERWHIYAIIFQSLMFVGLAVAAFHTPQKDIRILLECAMICLICPTASAAGVITERLGGKISGTVTYLIIINATATLLIPAVVPMVRPSADLGFWSYVLLLTMRIFPLLIVPCLLAWLIRYAFPKLHGFLKSHAGKSFYIWGVGLFLAIVLATKALVCSDISIGLIICIAFTSMACCALSFMFGRRAGGPSRPDSMTAGQTIGQKNTGFLIWLGYSYLTPVTSIAGGFYAIWQNMFNAWELYRHEHHKATS